MTITMHNSLRSRRWRFSDTVASALDRIRRWRAFRRLRNYWGGAGTILEINPAAHVSRVDPGWAYRSDDESLADDWRSLGDDLHAAIHAECAAARDRQLRRALRNYLDQLQHLKEERRRVEVELRYLVKRYSSREPRLNDALRAMNEVSPRLENVLHALEDASERPRHGQPQ